MLALNDISVLNFLFHLSLQLFFIAGVLSLTTAQYGHDHGYSDVQGTYAAPPPQQQADSVVMV